MYLHPDMQNMPHHSRILLRWITQAETALWEKEPPVPVARSAREKLSALLFDRLHAVAAPALSALVQARQSHRGAEYGSDPPQRARRSFFCAA